MGTEASAAGAIRGVRMCDETTTRLGGVGDCWNMTWAADDRQFTALCDGFSWPGMPDQGYWSSRGYAVRGTPPDVEFEFLPGYPGLPMKRDTDDYHFAYYGFGTLAVDGRIYQFLSTRNTIVERRFTGAKLVYSDDNGQTWRNQDGSTPVVWETWDERTNENQMFFREPGETFNMPTVLQMGKDYADNRDGYVYVYSPDGNAVDTMNRLVLARVSKDAVLERARYEFFAGLDADGGPTWSASIEDREPVCSFPEGWVLPIDFEENPATQPHSWHPSVVYDEPLGVYLMANFGMGIGSDESVDTATAAAHGAGGMHWFGRRSYLGLWAADTPWGPWRQIHEDASWAPADDPAARCYEIVIAPKWIAADGLSFWLVWTDFQRAPSDVPDEEFHRQLRVLVEAGRLEEAAHLHHEHMPYYGVNAQRVELIV